MAYRLRVIDYELRMTDYEHTDLRTQTYRNKHTDTNLKTQTYRHKRTDANVQTPTYGHRRTDTNIQTQTYSHRPSYREFCNVFVVEKVARVARWIRELFTEHANFQRT